MQDTTPNATPSETFAPAFAAARPVRIQAPDSKELAMAQATVAKALAHDVQQEIDGFIEDNGDSFGGVEDLIPMSPSLLHLDGELANGTPIELAAVVLLCRAYSLDLISVMGGKTPDLPECLDYL